MWIDITVLRNSENRFGTKYASETFQMELRETFLMDATKFSGLAGQVIMLKFNSKKAVMLRRLRFPIVAYIRKKFPHHIVLQWNSTAMQSRSGGIYFISVPGKTTEASIFEGKVQMIKPSFRKFHIKRILNSMSISVEYVCDNYEKYSYLTSQNMSNCDNILTVSFYGFR